MTPTSSRQSWTLSPKIQFLASTIVGSCALAYWISEAWRIPYFLVSLAILSLFGTAGAALWRWFGGMPRWPELGAMEAWIARIERLTLDEARKRAYLLLEDPTKFETTPASRPEDIPPELSSSLAELFSRYDSVRAVIGDAHLDRQAIGPSELDRELLRIGNMDFNELVVRAGEDALYEIDGSESSEEDLQASRMSSVFHWVLVTASVLYDEFEDVGPGEAARRDNPK